MSVPQDSRLSGGNQTLPVYLTRQVAARMLGLHDRAIEKLLEPDAYRRQHNDKLQGLYLESRIVSYRADRDGGADQ